MAWEVSLHGPPDGRLIFEGNHTPDPVLSWLLKSGMFYQKKEPVLIIDFFLLYTHHMARSIIVHEHTLMNHQKLMNLEPT